MFSCEYCKIFMNVYVGEHFRILVEELFLYFPISRFLTLMNSNFVQLPVAVKRSIESTISARHSRKMIMFGIIFANRTSDSPAFKEHLHLRNGRVFLDIALGKIFAVVSKRLFKCSIKTKVGFDIFISILKTMHWFRYTGMILISPVYLNQCKTLFLSEVIFLCSFPLFDSYSHTPYF